MGKTVVKQSDVNTVFERMDNTIDEGFDGYISQEKFNEIMGDVFGIEMDVPEKKGE
jgi:hypothetical protein